MEKSYSRKSRSFLDRLGLAELPQGLGLDLPDTLPGHAEVPANLFKGPAPAVLQTEPELEHAGLAVAQRVEHIVDLLLEELVGGRLGWRQGAPVLDEIAEVAVLLLADRRLQRDGLLPIS